jgi:hypothetical protein
MSGAAIVRALLAQHQPVADQVPGSRIVAGTLPQSTGSLPAISVRQVDENEEPTLARNRPSKMIRERVQVTVLASDYTQMKRILKAAALGAGVHTGEVVGFRVRAVLPAGVGPEIPPGDDGIYEQSRDFMVTFIEAN